MAEPPRQAVRHDQQEETDDRGEEVRQLDHRQRQVPGRSHQRRSQGGRHRGHKNIGAACEGEQTEHDRREQGRDVPCPAPEPLKGRSVPGKEAPAHSRCGQHQRHEIIDHAEGDQAGHQPLDRTGRNEQENDRLEHPDAARQAAQATSEARQRKDRHERSKADCGVFRQQREEDEARRRPVCKTDRDPRHHTLPSTGPQQAGISDMPEDKCQQDATDADGRLVRKTEMHRERRRFEHKAEPAERQRPDRQADPHEAGNRRTFIFRQAKPAINPGPDIAAGQFRLSEGVADGLRRERDEGKVPPGPREAQMTQCETIPQHSHRITRQHAGEGNQDSWPAQRGKPAIHLVHRHVIQPAMDGIDGGSEGKQGQQHRHRIAPGRIILRRVSVRTHARPL
jgi:hypothetical protein